MTDHPIVARKPPLARYGRKRGALPRSRSLDPDDLPDITDPALERHRPKRPRLLSDVQEVEHRSEKAEHGRTQPKSILKHAISKQAPTHTVPVLGNKANLPRNAVRATSVQPTTASTFLPAAFLTRIRPRNSGLRVFADPAALPSTSTFLPAEEVDETESPIVNGVRARRGRGHVLESTPARPGIRALPDLDISRISSVDDDSMAMPLVDDSMSTEVRVLDGAPLTDDMAVDRPRAAIGETLAPQLTQHRPASPGGPSFPSPLLPISPIDSTLNPVPDFAPTAQFLQPDSAITTLPPSTATVSTVNLSTGHLFVDSPAYELPSFECASLGAAINTVHPARAIATPPPLPPPVAEASIKADDEEADTSTSTRRVSSVRFQSPIAQTRSPTPSEEASTTEEELEVEVDAPPSPVVALKNKQPSSPSKASIETLRARFALSSIAPRPMYTMAMTEGSRSGTTKSKLPVPIRKQTTRRRAGSIEVETSTATPQQQQQQQRMKVTTHAKMVPLTAAFKQSRSTATTGSSKPASMSKPKRPSQQPDGGARGELVRATRILERAPSGASDSSEDPLAIVPKVNV